MRLVHAVVIGLLVVGSANLAIVTAGGQAPAAKPAVAAPLPPRLAAYKKAVAADIDGIYDFTQQMIDSVFSFGELGFLEFETQKYLTTILEKEGFTIVKGIAGIPTAWTATWGSGKPVIALGSDVDCIPQASQKPGVAYKDPMIEGAPGHGEGHNSGVPLNITAAIAAKRIMERDKLPGTLVLWPGVAEEQLGTKAYYVRAGLFKDVDVVLYSHVGSNLSTSWGDGGGNGLISVEYTFKGETAHSASAPWRGKSAMDAVELMNIGWNYRREHLRTQQRSHYVVTNGGDQPNVVPSNASVWYYLRETSYEGIKNMWAIADQIAKGATLPTVSLSFPANFQAGPGHNWANAIPMATPIAHKGVIAGAKVQAMTVLDIVTRPDVVSNAKDYFTNVQTKTRKYTPLLRAEDTPAIWLNEKIMAKYRPEMKKMYYDPTRYKTYLEQLGIQYPTVRASAPTSAQQ